MDPQRSQKRLLLVLILNGVSTALHYTDNALFLDQYPGPGWLTPALVFGALLFMTSFGFLGFWLYVRKLFWAAYLCLGFYSITGISSLGHYFYQMTELMSVKMHVLIWCDAIVGLSLVGFIIWSGLFLQEWRKGVVYSD